MKSNIRVPPQMSKATNAFGLKCLKAREPHCGVLNVVILHIHARKAHVEALHAL